MTYQQRYKDSHKLYYKLNFPNVVNDGHYSDPVIPDVTKTNGLTTYCLNMINWNGGRAKRVNAVVRASDKITVTESGARFNDKRYTRGIKKDTADIIGSLRGKMLNVEIKNKYTGDKMRPGQIEEMNKARRAGELYWIVIDVDSFLDQLDGFLYG